MGNNQCRTALAGFAAFAISTLAVTACGSGGSASPTPSPLPAATPKAACGPGSRPESGMQGRVPAAEIENGRAAEGYTCNTELIGSFVTPDSTGFVGGFKVERYVDQAGHDCAYYDTTLLFPSNSTPGAAGVNVMDMSDPANPRFVTRLSTPAMNSPHESLVVSKERGVLAAVLGNPFFGPGVVDLYDISVDCRAPVLKASLPVAFFGHESGISPDGMTLYASWLYGPQVTAIDISNLSAPVPLAALQFYSHGLSISDDGNRAYLAGGGIVDQRDLGLVVLDVSEIQARKTNPQVRVVSRLTWDNITIPQNALPITIKGKPYLVEIDEFSNSSNTGFVSAHGSRVGAGRIIDISDETKPKVISDLRLEVHQPENRAVIADDPGAQSATQGYAGHYCNVPSRVDPSIVACSMILSGLRIFDIRDPANPKEVAYFNAPIRSQPPTNPASASGYAMSSPAFVPERKEIWYSDGNNGFFVVRVTNDMWK